MGYPGPVAGWFIRGNPSQMDDDWGYPHVWKPHETPSHQLVRCKHPGVGISDQASAPVTIKDEPIIAMLGCSEGEFWTSGQFVQPSKNTVYSWKISEPPVEKGGKHPMIHRVSSVLVMQDVASINSIPRYPEVWENLWDIKLG